MAPPTSNAGQLSRESEYRTSFLMAHNRLHEILHGDGPLTEAAKAKHLKAYSAELKTAAAIASRPA